MKSEKNNRINMMYSERGISSLLIDSVSICACSFFLSFAAVSSLKQKQELFFLSCSFGRSNWCFFLCPFHVRTKHVHLFVFSSNVWRKINHIFYGLNAFSPEHCTLVLLAPSPCKSRLLITTLSFGFNLVFLCLCESRFGRVFVVVFSQSIFFCSILLTSFHGFATTLLY